MAVKVKCASTLLRQMIKFGLNVRKWQFSLLQWPAIKALVNGEGELLNSCLKFLNIRL